MHAVEFQETFACNALHLGVNDRLRNQNVADSTGYKHGMCSVCLFSKLISSVASSPYAFLGSPQICKSIKFQDHCLTLSYFADTSSSSELFTSMHHYGFRQIW